MKGAIIFCIYIAILSSCVSVEKAINIKRNDRNDNLSLVIDPTVKTMGFIIYIHIPESIIKAEFLDKNNNPVWIIEGKHTPIGSNGFEFGKLNKEYNQLFPHDNKLPEKLIQEEKYILILTTKKAIYRKEFVFIESSIKITNKDKIS